MKSLSAYRPRHWLPLIAGLAFVLNMVAGYLLIPGLGLSEVWSIALSAANVILMLTVGVSLLVYGVQWIMTLILTIMVSRANEYP